MQTVPEGPLCETCGTCAEAFPKLEQNEVIKEYWSTPDFKRQFQATSKVLTKAVARAWRDAVVSSSTRTGMRVSSSMAFVAEEDLVKLFDAPVPAHYPKPTTLVTANGEAKGYLFQPEGVPKSVRQRLVEEFHLTEVVRDEFYIDKGETLRDEQAADAFELVASGETKDRPSAARFAAYPKALNWSEYAKTVDKQQADTRAKETNAAAVRALVDAGVAGDTDAAASIRSVQSAIVQGSSRFNRPQLHLAQLVQPAPPPSHAGMRRRAGVGAGGAKDRQQAPPQKKRRAPLPSSGASLSTPVKVGGGKSSASVLASLDVGGSPGPKAESPEKPGGSVHEGDITLAYVSKHGNPFPSIDKILAGYDPGRELPAVCNILLMMQCRSHCFVRMHGPIKQLFDRCVYPTNVTSPPVRTRFEISICAADAI